MVTAQYRIALKVSTHTRPFSKLDNANPATKQARLTCFLRRRTMTGDLWVSISVHFQNKLQRLHCERVKLDPVSSSAAVFDRQESNFCVCVCVCVCRRERDRYVDKHCVLSMCIVSGRHESYPINYDVTQMSLHHSILFRAFKFLIHIIIICSEWMSCLILIL